MFHNLPFCESSLYGQGFEHLRFKQAKVFLKQTKIARIDCAVAIRVAHRKDYGALGSLSSLTSLQIREDDNEPTKRTSGSIGVSRYLVRQEKDLIQFRILQPTTQPPSRFTIAWGFIVRPENRHARCVSMPLNRIAKRARHDRLIVAQKIAEQVKTIVYMSAVLIIIQVLQCIYDQTAKLLAQFR